MSNNKTKWLVPVAFANIFIIWGTTFLAISYGLKGFPPFILSGLRFLVAGLIILAWLLIKGHKLGAFADWKKNAITGIFILTGGTGLVVWGEQYVSSTEAAIAIATGPFWFIALDKKNWRTYFSDKFIIIGLLIGFTGLILFLRGSVALPQPNVDPVMRILAFGVIALSSISWVIGSLYSKNNPTGQNTVMNTSQQLIVAGVVSFLIATFRTEWSAFSITGIPVVAWLGLAFLILFGSIVAYLSYIWLLTVKPPALVSVYTYINPIVAVILGWLFLSETVTGIQFLGLVVILAGVLMTNFKKYRFSKRFKVRLRRFNRQFSFAKVQYIINRFQL